MLLFLFKESPVNPKKNPSYSTSGSLHVLSHHFSNIWSFVQFVLLIQICGLSKAEKKKKIRSKSIRFAHGKNTHKTFASRWVPGSFIYQARHERKEKFKETTTAQSVFKVCFPQSTVRNSLLGIWEHLINSAWERGWRWEMEITKKKKKEETAFHI